MEDHDINADTHTRLEGTLAMCVMGVRVRPTLYAGGRSVGPRAWEGEHRRLPRGQQRRWRGGGGEEGKGLDESRTQVGWMVVRGGGVIWGERKVGKGSGGWKRRLRSQSVYFSRLRGNMSSWRRDARVSTGS